MSRWSLPFEEPKAPRPPSRWNVWRVLSWTLLFSALAFWTWALLAP